MASQEKGNFRPRVKRYMFFSQGTGYAFDPNKTVSYSGRLMTSLDFHKSEVKFRRNPHTFILDGFGNRLP